MGPRRWSPGRLVLACALAGGCRTRAPAAPPVPTPATVAVAPADAALAALEPKDLYLRLCAPCHGPAGQGYAADHAPSLVNRTFLESATDDFLRRSIMFGRPGTSMPAYGRAMGGPLDDATVDRLVAHLRAGGPEPVALKVGAAGDATRGARVYDATCKTCHGDASTRGEAVHLANMQFQALASDPFIRHAVAHGRPGTKMEAFAGKLTDAQIDDVVAYVRKLGTPGENVDLLPPPTGKEPLVLNPHGRDPSFTVRDDRFVSAEQVKTALEQKRRLIVIDARPQSEWMRVHVKGAVSIPYHDMKRLEDVPSDVWAIAYCACPHHLSGEVVDELVRRGHKRAAILDEGINEWHRRGYPVVAAKGVAAPPSEPRPAP